MTTRVIIVDDHKIIREGLRSLLDAEAEMEVVAEAADGRTAVKLARDLKPELMIMDIDMPDLNGVEATRQIMGENPRMKVIALSMHSDARFVGRMLHAGACGYLLKDCAFDELSDALRTVMDRNTYLSAGITGVVVDDYVRKLEKATEETPLSVLTAKEREVLQLLAEGKSTKEMAADLHVSVKTIETHRQNIMNKLEIRSIAELTKFAIREGLTSLDD